ncbi:MAG: PDZ domain-containing protein [Planctomycetia bacterium]|nr:PDZ domain-containing protein [Planctomycetia bacterium]
MLRILMLVAIALPLSGIAAPVPPVPDAKTLVAGLSDPSEKVRNESATALRDRVDALPWLRRATRSTDKDTAKRAADLLIPHEKKRQEAVAKVIDACIRDGHVDLFMEWHHYWQPASKDDLWPVGPRAAKAGRDLFAKSCSPEATKRLEHYLTEFGKRKFHFHDGPEERPKGLGSPVWNIRTDRFERWPADVQFASVAGPTHLGGRQGGHYFVLGSANARQIHGTFLVCDGDVWNGIIGSDIPRGFHTEPLLGVRVATSVVICRGNFRGKVAGSAVVLVEGDIDLQPAGPAEMIQDSLIRVSGEIRLAPKLKPVNCTIEAHAKNATAPYKFFELSDVGLVAADDEEGLVVRTVKPNTPFGNCGLAKGDLIRAIDDIPAGHSEEFRKKVRRALVRQGDCLLTVTRGDKTHDLAVFFPLPK